MGEKTAKYVLKESVKKTGHWLFNLIAKNGKVIGTSQLYENKQNAMIGINSVRKNGLMKKRFALLSTKGSEHPFFHLTAGNGEIILVSEYYKDERSRDKGIDSVSRNCNTMIIEEIPIKKAKK